MNLYVAEDMGKGKSYVAPEPHFISSLSLFANNLPWEKFTKFFEKKKLVNISAEEQVILLRLLAVQEILCLNDDALLTWTRNQLFVFSFLQADFKPRLPTKDLLKKFREEFDKVGLLKPFRKQCQRLIHEHESRFPPLTIDRNGVDSKIYSNPASDISSDKSKSHRHVSDTKVDLYNVKNSSDVSCPNCKSQNVFKLKATQESSTLPSISFSRCRFCGNTFRDQEKPTH